jgi:ribosomal protein S18 acetylase RimI-like enzyme
LDFAVIRQLPPFWSQECSFHFLHKHNNCKDFPSQEAENMKILRARLHDVDRVAVLFNEYRMFYKQPSDLEAARQYLAERLSKDESVIFIAIGNHTCLGFTQLYPSFSSVYLKHIWKLNDLYISEHARNMGIGQKLLEAAREHALRTESKNIILETDWDNMHAQHLYEKNGYEREDQVYHYTLPL